MMKHEQAAERLLTAMNIKSVPIPIDKIAKSLGVKVSYEPFDGKDDMSGVLIKKGDSVVIGINSSHAKTRQRFTLAHEIGHLVLKHKGDVFIDKTMRINRDSKSALAIDKNEIEANGFAAALLMPREMIMKEIQKRLTSKAGKKDYLLVDYLAGAFEVSSQSMEYRLNNLGILIPQ